MANTKITSRVIADDAVTTSAIADDAITTALIADDAITTELIADDQITSALIADNAVGISQLNVSDGTDGQVLKTNGSGTLSFGDASGGGGGVWSRVSTSTITSTNTSSVEFNLSSNKRYAIVMRDIKLSSNVSTYNTRVAWDVTDGGTYNDGIRVQRLSNSGSTVSPYAFNANAAEIYQGATSESGNDRHFGTMYIDNSVGFPVGYGEYHLLGPGSSSDSRGFAHFQFGFSNNSSTQYFSKIKFYSQHDYLNVHMVNGEIILYEIETS